MSAVEDQEQAAPQQPSAEEARRRRVRNLWQLDIPLVLVLALCVSATIIEVSRATDGNWRAGVYAVEWPLIGAFAVWMWIRFRREGGSFRGITNRWRERVARFEAEAAEVKEPVAPVAAPVDERVDPDLAAWQRYQAEVRQRDRESGRG